jgi:hypothetical protein
MLAASATALFSMPLAASVGFLSLFLGVEPA